MPHLHIGPTEINWISLLTVACTALLVWALPTSSSRKCHLQSSLCPCRDELNTNRKLNNIWHCTNLFDNSSKLHLVIHIACWLCLQKVQLIALLLSRFTALTLIRATVVVSLLDFCSSHSFHDPFPLSVFQNIEKVIFQEHKQAMSCIWWESCWFSPNYT